MKTYTYRKIFREHHGEGPHQCYDCGLELPFDEAVVHHIDHDRSNNTPANLAPMHRSCHVSLHMRGTRRPESWGRAISAAKKGVPQSAAHREANRQAQLGNRHTEETRRKMSRARKGRPVKANMTYRVCEDCGRTFNLVWLTRHRNEGKCVRVESR